MKCFAAFAVLGLIGLPIVGIFIYLLFTVPLLTLMFAGSLGLLAVIGSVGWAAVTASECIDNWRRK